MSSVSIERAGAEVLILADDDQSGLPVGAVRYVVEWVTDRERSAREVIAASLDDATRRVEAARSADDLSPRATSTRVMLGWLDG